MRRNNYEAMELKALRCFYVMAQRESVSQASIELGISEAAVSQRIKSLENYLGSKLYRSRGGHVRLTPAGQATFEFALFLFNEIDAFEQALHHGEQPEEILLAAHDSILRHFLPDKVRRFLFQNSAVRFSLLNRPVEEILRLVRSNDIDLGIVAKCKIPKEVMFTPISTYPACLIASKNGFLSNLTDMEVNLDEVFQNLEKHFLICLESKQEGRRLLESMEKVYPKIIVKIEVGTMDSLKHYVAIGLGYAVISAMSLTDKDKEKFDIIFLPPSLSAETTYGIVTRRDRLTNPTLDRFIALLLDTNL